MVRRTSWRSCGRDAPHCGCAFCGALTIGLIMSRYASTLGPTRSDPSYLNEEEEEREEKEDEEDQCKPKKHQRCWNTPHPSSLFRGPYDGPLVEIHALENPAACQNVVLGIPCHGST
eukprot:1450923-Pyramimonas_sp.AAC.1